MGRLVIVFLLLTAAGSVSAATCTITVSSNWNACTCNETGLAPVSGDNVTVNAGVTLTFSTVFTFAGTLTVYGTVVNNKPNVEWDGNVIIKSTGLVTLNDQLDIGAAGACGFNISVESGGQIDLTGSGGSDKLRICDIAIAQSGGGCHPYPTGPLPYCEPGGGFTGPFVFNQGGLPIELLYFRVAVPSGEHRTFIEWATEDEQNFDHFEIQRAGSDFKFSSILEVAGAGFNTNAISKYSAYDENPLMGNNFYRLKAVDIDGRTEYFKIKSLNYDGGYRLLVWSNPASAKGFTYSVNFEPGPGDHVVLVNQMGAEVMSAPVTGSQNELIPESPLKSGAYLLRYVSSGFQQTARVFIKE